MTREYTRKLLEMVDEGVLDPADIMTMALNALDEDEVADMCRANDLLEVMGIDQDEDEDDDYEWEKHPDEIDVDEAQEWADYDADC